MNPAVAINGHSPVAGHKQEIRLENVSRSYPTLHGRVSVLRGVDLLIRPGEKLGIIGRNGAGKSTLIRMISGAELPDIGKITRTMTVSWPLAFAGGFQTTLTGLDNLRFICRIYGQNWRDHLDFVEDFTELGRFFREPVGTYSSGMRSRLAFALSMVIDFDCFLIDEIMAVGDHRFHEKCRVELFEKRKHHAMIFVSHDPTFVREHCDRVAVLHEGLLHNYDDMGQAFDFYYHAGLALKVTAEEAQIREEAARERRRELGALLFGPHHAGLLASSQQTALEAAEAGMGGGNEAAPGEPPAPPEGDPAAFARWAFAHPLNHDIGVARHRRETRLDRRSLDILSLAFGTSLDDALVGSPLQSALLSLAAAHPDGAASAGLYAPEIGDTAHDVSATAWDNARATGGQLVLATFRRAADGRSLPLTLEFSRLPTDDPGHVELVEFELAEDGTRATASPALPGEYVGRLMTTLPFILPFLETADPVGRFGLALGDEASAGRVLGFCGPVPDFLVADPGFLASGGYVRERAILAEAPVWSQRENKAFWRGSDAGSRFYERLSELPRVGVTIQSRAHPEWLDAAITAVCDHPARDEVERYYRNEGLLADPVNGSLDESYCLGNYRYHIDIDGETSDARGFFLRLLSGSPVLKVDSERGLRQWYYDRLRPWENFVPVASDLSDLIPNLLWLRTHEDKALEIGRAGRDLALSVDYAGAVAEASRKVARLVLLGRRLRA